MRNTVLFLVFRYMSWPGKHQGDDKTDNQTACCSEERLLFVELSKNKTTYNTGSAPRRQEKTIYLADEGGAERIRRESRHNGESTAKAGQKVTGNDGE